MATALVTGASDGIGLELCRVLGSRGYNLILVARRGSLLDEIGQSMVADYGVKCTVIAKDLSKLGAASELFEATQQRGLHVDFLANNAGLLQNGFFTDIDLDMLEDMMIVNMLALTSITHLYANEMMRKKSGHILNIASLAAWTPIPNQNVYAATKAYVLAFSRALSDELTASGSGVTVTALCPGYTATRMMDNPQQGAKLKIPKSIMQSPRDVAEQGVLACLRGKATLVPGISNRISAVIAHLCPKMFLTRVLGGFYRRNMKPYA